MTTNRIYQATVEALESLLPPRVVSLVMREGLAQAGRSAAELDVDDLEALLTGPAFRRLQATMPVEQARAHVSEFLATIKALAERPVDSDDDAAAATTADVATGASGDGSGTASASAASGSPNARLETLRAALRPFNLYFDWPEVRKLRAQLQVADEELAARLDASASLDEADAQLLLVRQKLEDRLVLQARELAALEEALEIVASLGGPRVRRLEALIGQVRNAQQAREVAEAEIERAAGIARDLRKLMESSVAQPFVADPDAVSDDEAERHDHSAVPATSDDDLPTITIDDSTLTAEVSERLRQVDIEGERRSLEQLRTHHDELLRYLPHLTERFDEAQRALDAEQPLGERLSALRVELLDAEQTQRRHLEHELGAIDATVGRFADDDDGSLERAVRVARDVAAEALPPHADMTRLRDLHAALLERAEERARREAEQRAHTEQRRAQQRAVLERMTRAIDRAPLGDGAQLDAARQSLRDAIAALAAAERDERLDDDAVAQAHAAEQRWEQALAARASDAQERHRAQLRELHARLDAIPDVGGVAERRDRLISDVREAAASTQLSGSHVDTLASMVTQVHGDALDAAARQLDRIGQEAGDAPGAAVLEAFQHAARQLHDGTFPDIAALRSIVSDTRERQRNEEQRRWQRLQQALTRLEPAGVPALVTLQERLEAVREALHNGRNAAEALDAAEASVADVEDEIAERLERFGPRLDAALATLAQVERLNNDDVATVRRVLRHLDSQRDALARVSPGLQHQLDRSLVEAEALLPDLVAAYDATREIADRLVEGDLFDDMLGFFDDLADTAAAPAPAAWRESEALQALMAGFRGLDDVEAAAVVSSDGRVRAGDLGGLDPEPVATALRNAGSGWTSLGAALDDRPPELVDLALGPRHALLTPVGSDAHALVLVRSSGAISALATRLREQRAALIDAVAAAS